ncbi:hypothetical protein C2G38_2190112 [Gigaspora rosea]|uniref:Uncharacterized protein n=1 Tax=Gigaspora rosea TaxID=44941 RepID=A0A397V446_9GLOM|nr:hypothetical protein C2G38_2190112 [Gigaspora rosea]
MPPKTNFGPCTIQNCQYKYSHLIQNQHQLCDHHYLLIVEPNRNNHNYSKINETFQNLQKTEKSSESKWDNIHLEILDDKVSKLQLLILVIYNQQQKFGNNPEYDPIKFKQMLEQNKSKLIGFFDKLVEGLIPKTRNIGLHLASAGTSYKGIDILSNTGLTVLSKTVLRFKQQIVEDYFKQITNYNNIPLFNPVNIDANNLCKYLKQIYSSLFDRKRSMKNLQLVDFKEFKLHSFDNYADALKMIIIIPSLNNYLKQNKIVTYLKIQQSTSNIPQIYKNFHSIIGPLHVALNSKETALIINYKFFKQLFHFVSAQKAWQKIKKIILEKFGPYCKDTEYRMAIDLLDNIIPATLDIYAVLFRSGSYMEYIETIFRIWTFALKWSRKNYNKAPLAFLSDIFYWTDNNHPFNESIRNEIIREAFVIAEVLICSHEYHKICYNAMEGRCKFCYDYYKTGIKNNVKSFINRLEKRANILTEDDIDIDNDENIENENNNNNNNNNDDDDVENLNLVLSEKDKIEQEFTNKLVNVLNW